MNNRTFRAACLWAALVCCASPFVLLLLGEKGPTGVRVIPIKFITFPALLGGALICATLIDIWRSGRSVRWVLLLLLGPVGLAIYWYTQLAGQNDPKKTIEERV